MSGSHNQPFRKGMNQHGMARAFSHIPGVFYPARKESLLSSPPKGYIETAECAKLFKTTSSAVRMFLHKRLVKHVKVAEAGHVHRLFWLEATVQKILSRQPEIIDSVPSGWLSAERTSSLLGVSRATLFRYEKRGLVKSKVCRMITPKGSRKFCIYSEEHIMDICPLIERRKNLISGLVEINKSLKIKNKRKK